MKVWQSKLVRATADVINIVKKAEEGAWKAGLGLKEEALRRWLEEQLSKTSKIEEGLDRKGREFAKRIKIKENRRSAEGLQKYGMQTDWRQEEVRRFKQQVKKEQVYSQPGTHKQNHRKKLCGRQGDTESDETKS